MASSTATHCMPPVVNRVVSRINNGEFGVDTSRARRDLEAQELERQIRNNGELAALLNRVQVNENASNNAPDNGSDAEEDTNSYDLEQQDESNELPHTGEQNNNSRITASHTHIRRLEAQIRNKNGRIQELETANDDLTSEIERLRQSHREAEDALDNALAASEDSSEHRNAVSMLKERIEELKKERNESVAEIEELRRTVRELRTNIDQEKEKVQRLERQNTEVDQIDTMSNSAMSRSTSKKQRKSNSKSTRKVFSVELEVNVGKKDNKKSHKHRSK